MAVLTSAMPGQEGGGAVPMRESVAEQNQSVVQSVREQQRRISGEQSAEGGPTYPTDGQQQQTQQPTTYMVTVTRGIMPGMQFAVEVEGQRMSECTHRSLLLFVC